MINDVPLVGAAPNRYALPAAMAGLDEAAQRALGRLPAELGPEVGILDSHFDEVPRLLGMLGFRPRLIASEDLADAGVRLAAIGCPHRRTRLDAIDTERFLERGGILISSDRAARLPGVAAHIRTLPARGPARARIATRYDDDQTPNAAVWLDAGHVPLDGSNRRETGIEVLAFDRLSGDALVIRAQAGRGSIIHSVPHWVQVPSEELMTAVERRPLRAVPAYTTTGNSYPGITLGAYLAQQAMLRLLLEGLEPAVEGAPADTQRNRYTEG